MKGIKMYKDGIKGWLKHLDFMILDIFSLELGFILAYLIREGVPEAGIPRIYINVMMMLIFIDICAVFFLNSYSNIIYRTYMEEIKKACTHCAIVVVGMIVWMFSSKISAVYSRTIVIGMYPICVLLMIGTRLVWKRLVRIRIQKNKAARKVLLITTDEYVEETIAGMLTPYHGYQVSAVVLYDNPKRIGEYIGEVPIVADCDTYLEYIKENVIDEVFLDLKGQDRETEQLMKQMVNMGLTVHINLLHFSEVPNNHQVHNLGDFTVLSTGMKFATPGQLIIKRLMDICGAIVGLVFTGIACIIFGPIIKKQSPGPIFFSQERVGRNGRTFKIYKLRTMYMDAEERKKELMDQNKMSGFMFKMDNDPRIIPIGHFLRKSSIDELPQFWNVLKGDMSLVGTRPPTVDEYEQYETAHRKRLAMKPGITGMWQVSGRSDIVDFEEVVALDAKYITEWTLGMDIEILWKTVLLVFSGKGAV
jgi:exopolysaccharide biosynthesis polyprenyl glycosylphosphotransferase